MAIALCAGGRNAHGWLQLSSRGGQRRQAAAGGAGGGRHLKSSPSLSRRSRAASSSSRSCRAPTRNSSPRPANRGSKNSIFSMILPCCHCLLGLIGTAGSRPPLNASGRLLDHSAPIRWMGQPHSAPVEAPSLLGRGRRHGTEILAGAIHTQPTHIAAPAPSHASASRLHLTQRAAPGGNRELSHNAGNLQRAGGAGVRQQAERHARQPSRPAGGTPGGRRLGMAVCRWWRFGRAAGAPRSLPCLATASPRCRRSTAAPRW